MREKCRIRLRDSFLSFTLIYDANHPRGLTHARHSYLCRLVRPTGNRLVRSFWFHRTGYAAVFGVFLRIFAHGTWEFGPIFKRYEQGKMRTGK